MNVVYHHVCLFSHIRSMRKADVQSRHMRAKERMGRLKRRLQRSLTETTDATLFYPDTGGEQRKRRRRRRCKQVDEDIE